MTEKDLPLLTAADIEALPETQHVHQFNDNAIRMTRSLGDLLGLATMGVHLVRLEPGRDSTQYHFHHQDEEFVYIISGSGEADLGEHTRAIGAGDFMAFTQHSVAHVMRNTGKEDLVYLMGGTRSDIDVCDYPRIGRRMFRIDGVKSYVALDDLHDVVPRR